MRETKIAPADVAGKLMAKNHKKDVDGSLKDLVQSLVTRKTYHTSHSDDHNKKPSGKKRKSISWIVLGCLIYLSLNLLILYCSNVV